MAVSLQLTISLPYLGNMVSKQQLYWSDAYQRNPPMPTQGSMILFSVSDGVLPHHHPDFCYKKAKSDNLYKAVWVLGSVPAFTSRNEAGPCRVGRFQGDSEVGTWWKLCEEGKVTEAVEALDLLVQRNYFVEVSLFYRILKRCMAQKDLTLGKRVHAISLKCGYEGNSFLANHFICMYAAHGRLVEATEVFNKVGAPNAFMWASIIKGHAEHGHPEHAIHLYRQMRESSVEPNNHVFVAVLKACANAANLAVGKEIHTDILGSALEPDLFVSNCLVDMYAKCGSLEDARRVFDRLPTRDVVTWTAIMAGYVRNGFGQEALSLYARMLKEGVPANQATFVCVLKACGNVKDLQQGKELHALVQQRGLDTDMVVSSCLVDMYAKCGSLEDARRVFDRMPSKDVVIWTAMIAGYVQHGLGQEALSLYASMQQQGVITANQVTFVYLLQACGSVRDVQQGKQLHAQIQEQRLEANVVVGSCLVDMYAKCGSIQDARDVFDSLPTKDVVTWTALIAGYAQSGLSEEALAFYASMQQEGITPADQVTFVRLLQAFTSIKALHEGKELHALIQQRGLDADVAVGSCLVEMYTKCGSLEDAQRVFEMLPSRDAVSWTAMIAGYAQCGLVTGALSLYASMRQEGITPANQVTYVRILQAFASIRALREGRELHAMLQEGGVEIDLGLGNCLVDMYAKCGSLEEARRVFDSLPMKDVVSWTSMIAGYAQAGLAQDALSLYASMQEEGTIPANQVTFMCLLQTCASVGALHQGKQLDAQIEERGLGADLLVGNCLVDMYAKCGSLVDARRVLERMPTRNVVTWTALLNGYAHHGESQMAMQCFEEMQQQGVKPNDATFICLLVACCHAGLVKEGQQYFTMMEDQGLTPTVCHYNCMVDLLGRTGQLEEAEKMLQTMPSQNDVVGWRSLLTACRSHGDVERGRRCFDRVIEVEPGDASAYVLMGNIYVDAGMWGHVETIESMRMRAGAAKVPAKACIEVKQKVHEFNVGDERDDISTKLKSMYLGIQEEAVQNTELVVKAASDSRQRDAFYRHAEKMALAYGLMHTAEGTRLLITKNLRMCNDCHNSTKIISRLEKREIIVRDGHRVHQFVDGVCSCGDRH